MASEDFGVDDYAVPLARGERPDVWGLNLQLLSPPADSWQAAYDDFVAALRLELPAEDLAAMYFYPFDSLHLTVASPCLFTKPVPMTDDDKAKLTRQWVGLLATALASPGVLPAATVDVSVDRVELHKKAAVLRVEDPSGLINRVRDAVRGLVAASEPFGAPSNDFFHMTFMRVVGPVPAGARARFEAVCCRWRAVPAPAPELRLVEETTPYMHMPAGVPAHTKAQWDAVAGKK